MTQCPDNFPAPLICLEETDSTSQALTALCNEQSPEELTTLTARFQTAGKGQRGNSWESEKDKNLLFSFVLFPAFLEARKQFLLSQIISLAVKEELQQYTGDISIKWPNDIYWKDKKICGMLIENNLTGMYITRSIAGIGININQEIFVSSAPNPVSLKQITGQEYDRLEILAHIIERVKEYYSILQKGEIQPINQRYREALFRKDGMHSFRDSRGVFKAMIVNVEADGHLVLQDKADRIRRYVFKEVQYVV